MLLLHRFDGAYHCFHPQAGQIRKLLPCERDPKRDAGVSLIVVLAKIFDKRDQPVLSLFHGDFRKHNRFVDQPAAEDLGEVEVYFKIVAQELEELFVRTFPEFAVEHRERRRGIGHAVEEWRFPQTIYFHKIPLDKFTSVLVIVQHLDSARAHNEEMGCAIPLFEECFALFELYDLCSVFPERSFGDHALLVRFRRILTHILLIIEYHNSKSVVMTWRIPLQLDGFNVGKWQGRW